MTKRICTKEYQEWLYRIFWLGDQLKKCFICFPLICNEWIIPFISFIKYELKPTMFSIWYGLINRDSNFVWRDSFSFSLFHNNTNWSFWKSFELVLLSKYFLTTYYFLFISNIAHSFYSSNFKGSLYILCIGDCFYFSSTCIVSAREFNSKCKGNIDYFPYTEAYR